MGESVSKRSRKKSAGQPEEKLRPAARRRVSPEAESSLLELQRSIGNQAVGRLLQSGMGGEAGERQAPPMGLPGDRFEKEADSVADRVMAERRSNQGENPEKTSPHTTAAPSAQGSQGRGQPLPEGVRSFYESRFGTDLSRVRVHTDDRAAGSAESLRAHAYTVGSDIVFGKGEYAPETSQGQRLLAHELTHVVQQQGTAGGSRIVSQSSPVQVQGRFFDDAWDWVKSAARTVGGAITTAAGWLGERARDAGRFLTGAAEWVGERLRDASMWVVNLIRDLPARLTRLATAIWEGLSGVVTFIPEAIQALASGGISGFASWLWEKAKSGGAWVLRLVSRVFDLLGGPELLEFIWHMITKARPMTPEEIAAASSVLGSDAIRWGDVRVSKGGLLNLIFALNNKRAFASFHTINLPEGESMGTVVHEATHVYQYERAGAVYLGEAIHAQATRGAGAYNYGGHAGLVSAKASGKHFRDFNREEQAQIAQNYYIYIILGHGTVLTADERAAYEYFIGELRAGDL